MIQNTIITQADPNQHQDGQKTLIRIIHETNKKLRSQTENYNKTFNHDRNCSKVLTSGSEGSGKATEC